ncbi:MAG: hypothetical protein AB1555_08835 [Nitrospirota bacterium]
MMMARRLGDEQGTTLLELLIGLVAGAVVLSAVLQTLKHCQSRFHAQQDTIARHQDLRLGLEVMGSELRMAGSGFSPADRTVRKADSQEVEFAANLGGYVTTLAQPVMAGQQELPVGDGTDWPKGKRIVVCAAERCAEGRLAKDGQRARLTLAAPLGQFFPPGSVVSVSNDVRYYLGRDERGAARVMRMVDGGAGTLIGDVAHFELKYFDREGRPAHALDRVARVRVEVAVGRGRAIVTHDIGLRG